MSKQKTVNSEQKNHGLKTVLCSLFSVHCRAERGFTLLLAALVASIVLALGTSIFSLAQKQLVLSSIGRDSQYAFYSADTAAECALYWDSRFQRFPTSTPVVVNVTCDGQTMQTTATSQGNSVTSSFQFEPNGYCANISVQKTLIGQNTQTVVHADGFSTRCSVVATSPRALQRSVELHY